ncbi:MAG: TolC family protein [Vicinamibacterales bacterium]
MSRSKSISMMTLVLALAGFVLPVYAQKSGPVPSEARIQELIRVAAERVAAGQGTQAATGAQPAGQVDTRPVVRLTIEDAVKAALDNNLDITVQRLNPQLQDIAIASARSVYRPTLTSQLSQQSQTTASTSTVAGGATAGAAVVQETTVFNGNIAQSVPWFGGSIVANLNNNKVSTTSLNAQYSPLYTPNWSAQYTQPILRNLKIDGTRQTLEVTRVNRDISDVQLKQTMTNTLSNVRNAYWDYVFAVQNVEVVRQSLALSEKLVQDNQTRVQVGTMAPIDVVQAQSQAATQRQNLVVAQATMRTSEITLKRLLVSGTQDPLWNSTIDPVDRPDFRPEAIDLPAAIRRALSERTDVMIARKNLESNDVTLSYLRNQTLPQADVVALYGLTGTGGDLLGKTGTGVNQFVDPSKTIPGGYSDALNSLFNRNNPRWTLQVNISYPLGMSAQKAAISRAAVQQNQIDAQLKQLELQVATDVTNAAINVQSNAERVQAAQAARELAEQQNAAENSKFEVGMSTNYNVVQSQRDLATARNTELQAMLNYRKSLVELDRLQQTTLGGAGITVIGR